MHLRLLFTMLLAISLCGCQWLANHRNYTQQGNIIAADRVAQLRIGMSKGEVANIIGVPVYDSPFSTDRWVFINTQQAGSRKITITRLTLVFSGDHLTKILPS